MNRLRRRRRKLTPFAVHPVLPEVLDMDWLKRAKADVQRYKRSIDSTVGQLLEDALRKVKSRRRRGDGAGMVRVHRLIPFPVARLGASFTNVGRQRRLAEFREQFQRRTGFQWSKEPATIG